VFRCHGTDEFHDDNGLACACATEDARLAAFGERGDQVNNLYAGFEHFHAGGLFGKRGGRAVNGVIGGGIDVTLFVDGVTKHVENTPQGCRSNGNHDGSAGCLCRNTTLQTIG
jgi:hypothetical protein